MVDLSSDGENLRNGKTNVLGFNKKEAGMMFTMWEAWKVMRFGVRCLYLQPTLLLFYFRSVSCGNRQNM